MKPKVVWIGMVVGLLGLSVVTHGILLVFALTDPSFAVEPDYEKKAAAWDEHMRAEAAGARLAWDVDLRTTPADVPAAVDVDIAITDANGDAIADAVIEIEAFHNARASRILRHRIDTPEDDRYAARLPIRLSGIWEFRLKITRGADSLERTIRASVLAPLRNPGSRP